MTNIQCEGRKEIDLLAINPVSGKKFHVESSVKTSPNLFLTYEGTNAKGKPDRKRLDYYHEKKFDHSAVVEKVKELFGDTDYHKILVVWAVAETDAMGENFKSYASHKYGIEIHSIMELISVLMEKGTTKGSRDDISRLIELMSWADRRIEKALEKASRRARRTKIVSI